MTDTPNPRPPREPDPYLPVDEVRMILDDRVSLIERLHTAQAHIEQQRRLIDSYQAAATNQNPLFCQEPINLRGQSPVATCAAELDPHAYLVVWRSAETPTSNGPTWHVEVTAHSAQEAFVAVAYRDGQLGREASLIGVLDLTTVR